MDLRIAPTPQPASRSYESKSETGIPPLLVNGHSGGERRNEGSVGEADSAPTATAGAAAGGCPSPLSSEQVLHAFRSRCEAWTLDRGRYALSGRTWGRGQPLYFLNGIGGTHELFAFVVWLLREQFRCVLFDYPPYTSASIRGDELSAADLAADLFAVADAHGDERFPLVATSFGSLVGLTAMLQRPFRIEQAVIQAGFAYRRLSLAERLLIRVFQHVPATYDRLPFRKSVQRQNHRRWFPPYDRERWQFFVTNTGQLPLAGLAQRSAIVRDTDLRPRLGEIEQPVLLIHAEGDGVVAEECHRGLEGGLLHSQSEWFANCGHLPAVTHPHRLAKTIRQYLLEENEQVEQAATSAGSP